jgi:hypothetical protein
MINKYNSDTGAIQDDFDMQMSEQTFNNQQKTQQMSEL